MTIRHYLTSLSILLIILMITSCGSPDSPEFGDSYEDVVKYVLHKQKTWAQLGSILFENDKIIHNVVSETFSDAVVREYNFEDNILVSDLWVMHDPDGSILKLNLNGAGARYQYKQVYVGGKKTYFTKDSEGNSQYLYREYSDHFSGPSLHRYTLPAK